MHAGIPTLFFETARCQNRDCLQPWFCMSAPSQNMHNSTAQRQRGTRDKGGHMESSQYNEFFSTLL